MADRCEHCDRESCTVASLAASLPANRTSPELYAAEQDCEAHTVDWRARNSAAEQEIKRLRELALEACDIAQGLLPKLLRKYITRGTRARLDDIRTALGDNAP